ncbi:glycosyltransferase [Haloactinopolyspora sp.]|uniref:glycosyltransferase n=1 Tax=Haloactinopolyspora sp. TaxID=1966353 RepID=UPI0026207911|nr:glycosyltransferase [Haloactinopolyspora sp.]
MPEPENPGLARASSVGAAERTVDVLDISDLRFPGGTSHSIAEEITAQARAGYTTGLITLNGPLIAKVAPVNRHIRRAVEAGQATLFIGPEPVHARVTVVRHPAVLQHAAGQLPTVHTDHVVIVANAGPYDIDGHEHYRPEAVHEIAKEHFGVEPLWAPIGPLVRQSIVSRVPESALADSDWVNIIDVDAWQVASQRRPARPEPGTAARRPVIGRHSRSSPQKWPADATTLRAVYPDDGSWTVRVLGGADPVVNVLGTVPDSWEIMEFGAMSPREFLASLDFFVYYHNPNWIEAFGRTILEALATGVPAILPPHFEPVFGEAAIYAEPHEVRGVVERLHTDRDAYAAQVDRALRTARERFGHEAHIARLRELIGAPTDQRVPVSPAPVAAAKTPTALFISSNGAGMGHLTRLLAYAERVRPDLAAHFFSLSQAVPVVAGFGHTYEYLPSATAAGLEPRRWHAYFADRVTKTLERVEPSVVVFDGTWPYDGIVAIREAHPEIPWVWSRRGLWRAGKNHSQLKKTSWFDFVIEPGDFAAAADRGVTAQASAHRVGPVTLLDREDLQDRTQARLALGLDPTARLALVSLGAGNINDTSGDVGAVVAALRELDVEVCVTRPEIAVDGGRLDDVHVVRAYPLSRHYHAFDLAISATGYNSFHELLRFGVPSLFVPNSSTALDDQEARARFAAEQGWAHTLPSIAVDTAVPLLADLLERGEQMVKRVAAADPGNGAPDAAAQLLTLAGAR